ncbi:MAG: hypothetical protein NVS9B11_19610 [Candidatus Dormibacteraceae bacterium]
MKQLILATGIAAAILGACGGAGAGIPGPSATANPVGTPRGVLVTRADDRSTVRARVGDRVQIALGTEYDWRLDPPDGIVLAHGIQNYLLVRGTQAIWTAAAAGASTITASGTVVCPSGQACIQLAVPFKTTVIVAP